MTNAVFIRTAAALFATGMTFLTFSAAHAASPAEYRAAVETSIDKELRLPAGQHDGRHGTATLAVTVDANGRVESVKLLKSAGFASFDQEAIRTANRVSYPASAKGRTVAMILGFNEQVSNKAQAEGGEIVTAWAAEQDRKVRLAQETTAQQPDS